MTPRPLARLRHHVTGAIERGEASAVIERRAPVDVLAVMHDAEAKLHHPDQSAYTPGMIAARARVAALISAAGRVVEGYDAPSDATQTRINMESMRAALAAMGGDE